ncbi:hypothetical protein P9112_006883 [Eukaryota sp. TZLM1-RC]
MYTQLLHQITDQQHVISTLNKLIADPSTSFSTLKTTLEEFASQAAKDTSEDIISVLLDVISILSSQASQFADQILTLSETTATKFFDIAHPDAAIDVLKKVPLDFLTDSRKKAWILVSIAQIHIAIFEHALADQYLRKATPLVHEAKDSRLYCAYLGGQARLFDYFRNFHAATRSYIILSNKDPSAAQEALTSAIVTALLEPAGPQRLNHLAQLYSNEHTASSPLRGILEKAHKSRFLTSDDVTALKPFLCPHHFAVGADNVTTVVDGAIREHNISAISKFYKVVDIGTLSKILNIESESVVVDIVSKMVVEGRLRGKIDFLKREIELFNNSEKNRLGFVFGKINEAFDVHSRL